MPLRPRPADLAALCRALRAAGLGVDLRHELRLTALLARTGPVAPARLRRLVAAVTLADRAQRPTLDAVLDTWLPGLLTVAGSPAEEPEAWGAPPAAPEPPPPPDPPPGRPLALAALALIAALALLLWAIGPGEPTPDAGPPDARITDAGVADAAPDADPGAVPDPTGTLPVPTAEYVPLEIAPPPAALPLMAFGALALLGLLLPRRPTRAPLPPAEGPPAAPPPPAPLPPALSAWTAPADRRHMVWGVEHFLSDAHTHRLDLRASVQATARAGERPVVRLRRRRLPRTVWLWVDALAHPDAEALARQLHAELRRANLDARLAWTFGGPDHLVLDLPGQPELPVDHLDTPPEGCVAVWFTDSQGLDREGPAERARALKRLRTWPRLALARCGPAAGDLAAHARGLPVLAPEAVAAWIGKGRRAAPRAVDLSLWQAAAALAPAPVDADTLLALGADLGYPQPRAHLAALLAEAAPAGPRWTWAPAVAAPRLTWLGRQPELARALDFWRAHHAPPPGPGATPTARARALERALLDLWDQPAAAAEALAQLAGPQAPDAPEARPRRGLRRPPPRHPPRRGPRRRSCGPSSDPRRPGPPDPPRRPARPPRGPPGPPALALR